MVKEVAQSFLGRERAEVAAMTRNVIPVPASAGAG